MRHEEGSAVKTVTIKERSGITLIDVLTVDPGDQDQLVKILAEATETTLRHMPGYISSVIHKSVDGRKVRAMNNGRGSKTSRPCSSILK